MKSLPVFLLLSLLIIPSAQAEEAHSEEQRRRILNQLQYLAGQLNRMPKAPEMHHAIQLPEQDQVFVEPNSKNKETSP